MFQLPKKPQTITDVLKTSFRLYLYIFPKLIYVMLFNAAVVLIGHALRYYFAIDDSFEAKFTTGKLIISLTIFLITAILCAVALLISNEYIKGESLSIKSVIWQCYRKLGAILTGTVLFYCLILFSSISTILPCLFLLILFSMYLPAIVLEDNGLIAAFIMSSQVVWTNWWRTLGVFALAFIVPIILYVIGAVLMNFSHYIIAYVGNLVIYMLVSPFLVAEVIVLFRDLQQRKSLSFSS
jgi:hypothetical protein